MKKVLAILIVLSFTLNAAPVFAGGGKALSKPKNVSMFDSLSSHISKWGKSAPTARAKSLRGKKVVVKKRGTSVIVK